MVVFLGLPSDVGRAACSESGALALVDAAFARSGGPEAQQLKRDFCARCEIAAECLAAAMRDGEHGVWGGTGRKLRTRHGMPAPRTSYHRAS